MRFLSTAAVCLIGTAGLAQSPTPGMPSPGPMPMQGSATTQSSRVRAFNAGPNGQIRSLYMANGSVVDLGSSFGPDLNSQIHKGTRIRITGSRTEVSGQTIIVPQQLTIGQQSFAAHPDPGLNGQRADMPPPPDSNERARRGPVGDVGRAGMPPPPPAGPAGPGMPPPPPAGEGAPPNASSAASCRGRWFWSAAATAAGSPSDRT